MRNAKVALFVGLTGLSFMFANACAPKPYTPNAKEEIYGTWTNEKEGNRKILMFSDQTWKVYTYVNDTTPIETGTYQLLEKWKDADGTTWYHTNYVVLVGVTTGNMQELDRIDSSGKTWEYCYEPVGRFDNKNYPKKVDPESSSYHIFYRSEQ